MNKEEAISELEGYVMNNSNYDEEVAEAIQVVLKELEKLENRCGKLDKEAQAYLEEMMGDKTSKERTIKQLYDELEKKEKIIDAMAEFIGQDIRCVRPEIECNKMTHDCNKCIKQYFEKKVGE